MSSKKNIYMEMRKKLIKEKSIQQISHEELLTARAEAGEPEAKAILSGKFEENKLQEEASESQ